ncbi:YrhK family protein [Primorskyibacter flagellatus]|uniref:YrhK-like protein n=1 Tax=Primorskyibacter flagellatus TaxID=1387277 RepID=A0A1W2C602_9RHOB|nr:YrhK family protein [Primorskyibacter flagellatus]SMC80685.1 YrhK-like protein [Primorskyibacter flagellatus]
MQLFRHSNRTRNAKTQRVYAAYELAYTLVDFAAAISFTIGSVLFLWDSMKAPAIWLFIIGSFCFLCKPSLRLMRELKLWRMGKVDQLAKRAGAE